MPPPPETGLDIQHAEVITPDQPGLLPLEKAGVDLVRLLLLIISIFVLISIVWIWTSEWGYSRWLDSLKGHNIPASISDTVLKERADFREFWMKIFQMVLLNVLLPVLTALLGYTFGTSKVQSPSDASESA
jgi:hypothetical protein